MQSKPLVIRHDIYGIPFAAQFLGSNDFDIECLKIICRELNIKLSGKKADFVRYIEDYFTNSNQHEIAKNLIIPALINRNRMWLSFKLGKTDFNRLPTMADPAELVFNVGIPKTFYGPIFIKNDKKVCFYLNFELLPHWEIDKNNEYQKRAIRWLRIIRVTQNVISIHWQSFYNADNDDISDRETQLRYWEYIPNLFDDISNLLGVTLHDPNLSQLVLDELWERYRNPQDWEDLRIRAESGGVSLNARSAGSRNNDDGEIIDIKGIKHLARTISLAVIDEIHIQKKDGEIRKLEEVILRTMIKQFGAKSYEFSLVKNNEKLLKAHIYFGMKPKFPTKDCFPHIHFYTSWKNDKEQFDFILDNLLLKNADDRFIQSKLV